MPVSSTPHANQTLLGLTPSIFSMAGPSPSLFPKVVSPLPRPICFGIGFLSWNLSPQQPWGQRGRGNRLSSNTHRATSTLSGLAGRGGNGVPTGACNVAFGQSQVVPFKEFVLVSRSSEILNADHIFFLFFFLNSLSYFLSPFTTWVPGSKARWIHILYFLTLVPLPEKPSLL